MSSDAQTSRTSSYLAGGSSFEEGLAQAQAASGHFHGAVPQGSGTGGGAHGITGGGGSHGGGGGGGGGNGNGAQVSSLAEHLARAEETVGREHEKGLLYRQGPEGVAAAVAGEELPVRGGGAGMGGAAGGGGGGGGGMEGEGEEKIESLADMLKRADDGPGNLKETFRMVGLRDCGVCVCADV